MTSRPVEALRVAVVGAGTAGAAAALLLARAGHRVTVFEAVAQPGPVGAGILLQPTGQAVLARLGLLARVAARAAPVARLRCVTDAGRPIVHLAYAELGVTRAGRAVRGLGLHRGTLFETLFDALGREPGIELRLGVPVQRLARAPVGRLVVDARGRAHGRFDLVVVADGARSALHAEGPVPHRVRPYAWGALWFVAPDPERVFRDELFQVLTGTERMVGFLPTGRGPGPDATPVASLFWSVRADRAEAVRAGALGPLREHVLRCDPRAELFFEHLRDPRQLLFASYRDVVLGRFDAGDVVYVGDAAHATSPQLGQGANLALVDAATLADCVREHERLPDALVAYTERRAAAVRYYQLASRWLTPFFQGDSAALGALRDALFPIADAIGLLRGQMLRSMAGVKRGLFARSLGPGELALDEDDEAAP